MQLIGAYHKHSGQWCATAPVHDTTELGFRGEEVPPLLFANLLGKVEKECDHMLPIAWRVIDDKAPASLRERVRT